MFSQNLGDTLPNSTWTTDPLFMKVGDEYFYYQNDHLGTPQKLTAGNGEVVWSAKYNSFGEATVEVETVENNLRFGGQYEDAETGLHYNYFRYYDPEIGRYLRIDPIKFSGGINIYIYADGNSMNRIDPLGLAWSLGGGFGATIGFFHVSYSLGTETCCDDNGKKHLRSVESVCYGIRLGVSINSGRMSNTGPGSSSFSWNGKIGKCQGSDKTNSDRVYKTEDYNIGFSAGLVVGASWSEKDPTKTTITAGELGFGLNLSSNCFNRILKDVVTGCCN